MRHPNQRMLVSVKAVEFFKQLYPNNLIFTNLFKLDFLTNHQGIVVVVKQIRELENGDSAHLELLSTSKVEFQKFFEIMGMVVISSTLYALQPVSEIKVLKWNWEKVMNSFYANSIIYNGIGLEIQSFTKNGARTHNKVKEWLLCHEEPSELIRARVNELFAIDYGRPESQEKVL
jgi:hypothetical protein